MGRLDDLFKAAEGNPLVEINADSVMISPAMSDSEVLDFIMVQLCTVLDTSRLAFKGGYVLSNIIKTNIPRATEDIDFSISVKEYYDEVKSTLLNIGNMLLSSGVIVDYTVNEDIAELRTGGITIYRARDNQRIKLGVDVGLHDISYGTIPMNIIGLDVNVFSIERMLCDKISAMHTRKRFRRTKDLYDFFIITNSFNVDMKLLKAYIHQRGGLEVPETLTDNSILRGWEHAYNTLHIYNKDGNDIGLSVKPPFTDIINRLSSFVAALDSNAYWECGLKVFVK